MHGWYIDQFVHRRAVLRKWKEKQGLKATYGNLLRICCEAAVPDVATTICEILKSRAQDKGIKYYDCSD